MASHLDTVVTTNAAVRLLLEIAALLAFGYWGYQQGATTLWRYGLGIGIPLAVATVWALFGSPAAPYRLGDSPRLLLEVAILGGATLALYGTGRLSLALVYGAVAAVNTAILHVWG